MIFSKFSFDILSSPCLNRSVEHSRKLLLLFLKLYIQKRRADVTRLVAFFPSSFFIELNGKKNWHCCWRWARVRRAALPRGSKYIISEQLCQHTTEAAL